MQTGYQIAVHNPAYLHRPGTWLFAIIRLATGSYWNHWAGIVVGADGSVKVMEMRGRGRRRGIRKTSYDIWLKRRPDRIFEVLPTECSEEITAKCTTVSGIGYDFWSLALWHPLNRLTGYWLEPTFLRNTPYCTCSELWATLLRKPEAYRLSPGNLAVIFGASRK